VLLAGTLAVADAASASSGEISRAAADARLTEASRRRGRATVRVRRVGERVRTRVMAR
jgi:RNase P/RNase MRP subunit POP5